MRWLSWLRRRPPAPPIDRTGPATAYPHHSGAYGRAAVGWNQPTEIWPVITPAAERRGGRR